MNRQLTYAVVADGGTDRMLIPIMQWAVHRLDPNVEILEPVFRKRTGSVAEFLASRRPEVMLIFVHRDAENATLEERLREFELDERQDVVPVIPVRMSEAWLLIDGSAIARAAGSPKARVSVPALREIENIANPKEKLTTLLIEAAGSPTGRRGERFQRDLRKRRVSVANHIADFSPLEHLSAFRAFQKTLQLRYPYPLR